MPGPEEVFGDAYNAGYRAGVKAEREAAPEITEAMVGRALREINKFYPTSKFALPPSTVMKRVLRAAFDERGE